MKHRISLLVLLFLGIFRAGALELASPFVDNAVLQREMAVPVWGWAVPGTQVVVSFAGQEHRATAAPEGTWRVTLDPLTASAEPQSLVVKRSNGEEITRSRILVGEVWLASGQSNMDWVAGKSNCNSLAREVATARLPIREYKVDTGSALFPCSRADSAGGWQGPDKAGEFSALALAFAAELHRELGVPIGIMRSSHGATPVETWTALEGFVAQPELQDIVLRIKESDPSTPEGQAAFARYYDELKAWQSASAEQMERGGSALPRPPIPGIASDWKGATRMHNKKIAPLIPYAIRGVIWCQGEHNSDDGRIYAAKKQALLDGWRTCWNRPDLPFYFTQLQCYGNPDPNAVGFADAREAQTLFYRNNAHVGMVVQTDLNPATPGNIHPQNKLDPGKRLARWALAHEYGRTDLAFTGPIYASHRVVDGRVRVSFTQRGPGGGLMVGSKGQELDAKTNPDAFVEPARETPSEPLRHFRLAGRDGVWHAASAVIEGDEVVVSCPEVPEPVGVQYAYSGSPIGSNLYNRAGLPAIPFAVFNGRTLFQEDLVQPKTETAPTMRPTGSLSASSLLRNGIILQRDQKVPIWGRGIPGSEVTVRFAGQEKIATVDEFQRWSLHLDPMSASGEGRELHLRSNKNESVTIRDVLVGDVWFVTGSLALPGESFRPGEISGIDALPLAREFLIKTKTRRFPTPRKGGMEIGGGKYVSAWLPIAADSPENAPSVFAYHFAKAAQHPGVPIGVVTLGAENPPLTWISLEGMQSVEGFDRERDEINLGSPATAAAQNALAAYLAELKAYAARITELRKAGRDIPVELAESTPPFPQPPYNEWKSYTETATHTYNFCISPNTPCAVRGVVWVPAESNLGSDPSKYAKAVTAYARSLPSTYGQSNVSFIFAHPTPALADAVTQPDLPQAIRVDINEWPKSLTALATQLGAATKTP